MFDVWIWSYRDSGYYDYFHYLILIGKDYIIVYAHGGRREFGYKGHDEGRLLKKKILL